MKTLTSAQSQNFLSGDPTVLLTRINSIGQECVYMEHPVKGDTACVYVRIGDLIANTGFYDLGDFYYGSDYEPCLVNGDINCKFQFE